jgi:phosphopantetheinyl transferase (holo-ACP synthase)
MPPRPFPSAFNIGVDICYLPRFTKYFDVTRGEEVLKLFNKVFTPAEQRMFWDQRGDIIAKTELSKAAVDSMTRYLAGRCVFS